MVIFNSLMASLHHLSAFTVVACLAYEFIAYRRELSVAEARRIQLVDSWYGISAGAVLIAGLLRVFFFEKGANYYGANTIFWIKMGLFVIVGILSIYPTIRFIRWNPVLKEGRPIEVPEAEYRRVRLFLWVEVIGLALILFAAPAMARGIGMF
jgi:putative membrane protein